MRKCGKNTLCMNNVVVWVVLVAIFVGTVYLYFKIREKSTMIYKPVEPIQRENPLGEFYTNPNVLLSNSPTDTFLNPYVPPQRENHGYMTSNIRGRGSAIGSTIHYPNTLMSVHTNRTVSPFRQLGILTRAKEPEMILPLFGREIDTRRNKWNYYTMTSNNVMIKLPLSSKGRSCMNQHGCDELFNSDTVYVEGYKDLFHVTMYENNTMDYIP